MRVKIKDKWYDPDTEPIMIELSAQDKVNINGMIVTVSKYCEYPDDMPEHLVNQFMEIEDEED